MSNKKRCKLLVTAWIWIISLSSLSTYAATLSLSPALQEVALGESTTVNLNISDLGNIVDPSLGAFLVEITFDASILSFDTVSYGSYLGAPSETTITTSVGAGIVSLYESSLLLNSELDVIQPDSFTLATLQFTANNLGTSGLSFWYCRPKRCVWFSNISYIGRWQYYCGTDTSTHFVVFFWLH